jgi:hypothetical protein
MDKYLLQIFLIFGLLLGFTSKGLLAGENTNLLVEARGSYSILMAHRPNLEGYPNTHFGMYEISVGKKVSGSEAWHSLYHFPNIGASIFYSDIGKNKYTGSAMAGFAYIQFPYMRFKNSNFNFKLALGPGWIEKKFDRVNNYKNVVTGTHLNAAIQLTQSYEWRITNHQNLSIGLCLTHFSNGAFKLPNLGINLVGIQLAYQLKFNEKEAVVIDRSSFEKRFKYTIAYSAGLKQVYPVLGKQYFLSNFSAFAMYNYHEKGSAGFVIDIFKDASVLHQMKFDTDSSNNNKTNVQLALGAVYEVEIGKFTIPLMAGFYTFNNYKDLPFMYLKFALNYYLTKNINVSFSLKSHFAKADFFSYGLGYRF